MIGDSSTQASQQHIIPTINVKATAVVEAVPDEAHLTFTLTADARSAEGALEAVRKRLDEANKQCDHHGIPSSDRTSSASVAEHGERDGGKWLAKGYRAEAFMAVVVRDADAVGPLVSQVVAAAGPKVLGPYWRVSPDHPARLQACGKAGTQARAKAQAYASSLGSSLGRILTVAEPRLRTEVRRGPEPAAASMSALSRTRSVSQPAPDIDLHAGTQEIWAELEVVFELES